MIEYRKGDLFPGKPNTIMLHACNGIGRWSSGIAAEFAKRFPNAYELYSITCEINKDKKAGYGFLVQAEADIGCLVTSYGYGSQKDPPDKILEQTRSALKEFLNLKQIKDGIEIHSPKINSGLFAVPWKDTEAVIEEELKACGKDIKWVVWEL